MKICPKCGHQNQNDAKFCVGCGQNLEAVGVSQTSSASLKETAKTKTTIPPSAVKAGIAAVVLVILLAVIFKFAGCGKTKINLNDFVTVSVTGTDTVGTAYYTLDSNALYAKLAETIGVKNQGSTDPYYIMNSVSNESRRQKLSDLYDVIYGAFTGNLDKTTDLSNGDKVVFEWNNNEEQLKKIEKEFKVRFSYKKITQKVEDLEEIQEYDPFGDIEVRFSGYEASGKAEILNNNQDYDYDDPYFDYELDKQDGLSNGDKVTVTIPEAVDNEKEFEENCIRRWGITPTAVSKEYTVEGLGEAEDYDPFEQLKVSFSGTSPDAQISIDASNVDMDDLEFTADKEEHLKIGDTVTVTVSGAYGEDLETLFADTGRNLTTTSKEYTVENIPRYAEQLSDIPQDMLDKMDQNAQDKLNADAASNWGETEKITDISMSGNYFLTAKEDADIYDYWNGDDVWNKLYFVYKISVQAGENPFSYYTFVCYRNVLIMEDGSCSMDLSSTQMTDDTVYTSDNVYYYHGYADLDTLKYKTVTADVDNYTYEEKFN